MARRDHPSGFYSRLVGYLKVALPLLAVALFSTVFLFQTGDEIEGGISFSSDDRDTMRDGLAVHNPKFSGVNLRGDRFFLEAAKATPDSGEPEEVVLVELSGRTDYKDGFSVYLKAARGIVRLPEQLLELSGGLHISTSDGFEGLANGGTAGLDTGSFISDGPVTLDGPMGRLEAGAMRLDPAPEGATKENQVFTFENGVTLTLTPN